MKRSLFSFFGVMLIGVSLFLGIGSVRAAVGLDGSSPTKEQSQPNEHALSVEESAKSDAAKRICAANSAVASDMPTGSGAYMTANGRLFTLGDWLNCVRHLHPARVN